MKPRFYLDDFHYNDQTIIPVHNKKEVDSIIEYIKYEYPQYYDDIFLLKDLREHVDILCDDLCFSVKNLGFYLYRKGWRDELNVLDFNNFDWSVKRNCKFLCKH